MKMMILKVIGLFIVGMQALGLLIAVWGGICDAFGRKMNLKKYTREEIRRNENWAWGKGV